MYYDQSNFDIRFEWGLAGVRLLGSLVDVLIIVDALSFSTCVDVAVSRGAMVFPYRWKDESAEQYANELNAQLAGYRGEGGKFSLSPVSMRNVEEGMRIVLPSPNGSQLTMEAESLGKTILAGCFRNCGTVASFAQLLGKNIAVIAAGERWPDGALRPAVEDLTAAGAIIANLLGKKSPEALTAIAAWSLAKQDLHGFLSSSSSGRELVEKGFEEDVRLAAEVDVSKAVPIFRNRAFVNLLRK